MMQRSVGPNAPVSARPIGKAPTEGTLCYQSNNRLYDANPTRAASGPLIVRRQSHIGTCRVGKKLALDFLRYTQDKRDMYVLKIF